MSNTGRYFIALPVNEEVKNEAIKLQDFLSKNNDIKVKYVERQNLHITLKFLGEISKDKLNDIIESLKNIQNKYSYINLTSKDIDFFPSVSNPKVIYWSMFDNYKTSYQLVNDIENMLIKFGIPKEKKQFTPHLTLGRIKEYNKVKLNLIKPISLNFFIKEFILFQSFLKPSGPIYKTVESFSLTSKDVTLL